MNASVERTRSLWMRIDVLPEAASLDGSLRQTRVIAASPACRRPMSWLMQVFVVTGDSGQGITHGVLMGLLLKDRIVGGLSPGRRHTIPRARP